MGTSVGGQGRRRWLKATLKDASGQLDLVWFKGLAWIRDFVKPGAEYVVYGKVTRYKGIPSMAHPEMETPQSGRTTGYFQPIYGSTEKLNKRGMSSKGFEKAIHGIVSHPNFAIPENLPDWMREAFKLPDKTSAMRMIHRPQGERDAFMARRRLKFEELFYVQLELLLRKDVRNQRVRGFVLEEVGQNFNRFYAEHLPFDLTGAQKRVMKEIRRDLKSGTQMNRLLQGDVGSGKTMVAALASLIAMDNGFQAAVMAPTEILAEQHYQSLSKMLRELGMTVQLLTGSTPPAERLLNLVIALVNAPVRMTKEQIRASVAGYDQPTVEAFERTFELDKVHLRNLGIPLLTITDAAHGDDQGYRIDADAWSLPAIQLDAFVITQDSKRAFALDRGVFELDFANAIVSSLPLALVPTSINITPDDATLLMREELGPIHVYDIGAREVVRALGPGADPAPARK